MIGIGGSYLLYKNNNKEKLVDSKSKIEKTEEKVIENISKIDASGEEINKEDIKNLYDDVAYSTIIMCNYPNRFNVLNSTSEERMQIAFDSIKDFKRVDEQLYNKISLKSITIGEMQYELHINNLYIEREIIENKFYKIFGNDYNFDKNVSVSACGAFCTKFIYNESLDIFVDYSYMHGSVCSCSCEWGGSEIYKAYKKNNKLKIYTITSDNKKIDSIFTFNFENEKYVFDSFEHII